MYTVLRPRKQGFLTVSIEYLLMYANGVATVGPNLAGAIIAASIWRA